MKKLLSAGALVSAMALSGCSAIGTDFNLNCADNLTPKVSTKADAISDCGPIYDEIQDDEGHSHVFWRYYKVFSYWDTSKDMIMTFDKDGKLIRIDAKIAY